MNYITQTQFYTLFINTSQTIIFIIKYFYNKWEEFVKNLVIQDFVYNEDRNENPQPGWWDKEPHSRVPRGAVAKFVSSLNSAISNIFLHEN